MKLRQNVRHWAAKKALTTPIVGEKAREKLVDLHTRIFLDKADEANRDEREAHLDDFFAATMDSYVAALEAGFTEAEAREVTHIQANFDFFNHGWAEMMEIPADELEEHYRRYDDFFAAHNITIDDPLGDFRPVDGITDAPATPEAMEEGVFENAVAGFADDVYLDDGGAVHRGGDTEEPDDVPLDESPGVSEEDAPADD
ncbi:MAG: DUF6149 family protein [Halobacteriales archaeon]|nr:DUF6149 family protein [Halobacteriales archaeon]